MRIAGSALLLWLAQPPLAWWPIALIALVPWLVEIVKSANRDDTTADTDTIGTEPLHRLYRNLWIAATCYWLISLQGLRHAHPAMFVCWIALSGYLAIYPVVFVWITRAWLCRGASLIIAAPVAWVGLECIRNYLLTGLSAAMLGHSLANVPALVQIADLGGTYAVSLVLVLINVAITELILWGPHRRERRFPVISVATASLAVLGTYLYGNMRLSEPTTPGRTSFMLVGRDEQVEYDQSAERADEIFGAYAQGTIQAARGSELIDVVVWPESMFSGSLPWFIADRGGKVPDGMVLDDYHSYFRQRTQGLGRAVAQATGQPTSPHLIVGCGVVRFADVPLVYSGIVHADRSGKVSDWYGKTHLVMFGEYVPLVNWIPGVRSLVPPGLGVQVGGGAKSFEIDSMQVAGNICIETAVERVAVNHCAVLRAAGRMPDAIVTVTNDGWFDQSSVVDHHLRCAQLVAVGCRRPILSAANGGPTAWIDSCGRVVQALDYAANGAIHAVPAVDMRESVYVRIGDWPARTAGMAVLVSMAWLCWQSRRTRKKISPAQRAGD